MSLVIEKIKQQINNVVDAPTYLDVLFNQHSIAELDKKDIVLFGAGALGREMFRTLKNHKINVSCFVDNDPGKVGCDVYGRPVLTKNELSEKYPDSLVVLAVQKHISELKEQLIELGFHKSQIFCSDDNPETDYIFMYSMVGSQALMYEIMELFPDKGVLGLYEDYKDDIQKVYELLADQKSKELFVAKLALMASDQSYALFKTFIDNFSEPLSIFGPFQYDGTPEDYFYFNNDVLSLNEDEVFVDVGAFDGDTIETFNDACKKQNISYKHIYAVEPDPPCYDALIKETEKFTNITYHKVAFGARKGSLNFLSSDQADKYGVGIQHEDGNISVDVIKMDDFSFEEPPTFIKMDPGANVIPDILAGAKETIQRNKPKLALGAYHSAKALFEVPLLVHKICPEYKIYLRHGTYHLSDTDMFAYV